MRCVRTIWTALLLCGTCLALIASPASGYSRALAPAGQTVDPPDPGPGAAGASRSIYLPYISRPSDGRFPPPPAGALRVNAPYFDGQVPFGETAIFWFGSLSQHGNYADVRVAYTNQELYIHLMAFDRFVWYDPQPAVADLTTWDAASLYLDLDGNSGNTPDASSYRFDGQFNWWEARAGYQAVFKGAGWGPANLPFNTEATWEGEAPNDNSSGSERGWSLSYHIPFSSLGLTGPPARGTVWGMALALHDRDEAGSAPLPDRDWPDGVNFSSPASWGQLAFGLPADTPPQVPTAGTVTIRNKLNGAVVPDAAVGGTMGNMCPGDNNYIFNEWANQNFAGAKEFNVQNQRNVADFPCFSKYFVTFPLDQIPSGKVITSAALTLYLWGGAGGGQWGEPPRSLVQVLTVAGNWEESTLTWNNAPLAKENIARTWVDPYQGEIQWPGAPYSWDVRRAVEIAYAAGQPLRLAVYSADEPLHTGKYFTSSDQDDWDARGRPTLTITWGNP